jgi:AcrR family transcriptional regulator
MVRKADRPGHIIKAALELAAAGRWSRISLRDIAVAAGVSLAELHELYPSKSAILRAHFDAIDAAVLKDTAEFDPDDSSRDRLFDVLMRRFDALNRDAIAAIVAATCRDPIAGLCLSAGLMRSMQWMLEAAGIRTAGPGGRMRVRGLAVVWLATARVWLRDDSEDGARTMAALDRNLARAERVALALTCRNTPQPETAPA